MNKFNNDYPIIENLGFDELGVISPNIVFDGEINLPEQIDTALVIFDPRPDSNIINESTLLYHFIAASTRLPQYVYRDKLVIAYAPLGGPAAGGLVEELIALGIKKIVACGSAGAIQDFDQSQLLVVNKAIRDEGLSYHYLKPSIYVENDDYLVKKIQRELKKKNIDFFEGMTWTTDAFYRETKSRIAKRIEQGAVAVEMENASMAAVAKYRNIQFAQVMYFSDVIHNDGWSGFHLNRKQIKEKVQTVMIEIALNL
ncbi:MAG: nucleoside phosphorylase [Tenericutes bacterium]|jgi:uridine phosphorylase|nr:nucleoside phosphorylase [Mycoplasmatota bacterium]